MINIAGIAEAQGTNEARAAVAVSSSARASGRDAFHRVPFFKRRAGDIWDAVERVLTTGGSAAFGFIWEVVLVFILASLEQFG